MSDSLLLPLSWFLSRVFSFVLYRASCLVDY
jgi:hypothetical protein